MADPKIRIKRSAVAGRIPSVDQVPLGELALNTWDGQLYASKNVGLGTTVVAVNPWLVGTGTDSYNAYFTAGNIGIGSTTPTSALHVVGDAYVSGVVTANAGFNLGISSAGSVITSGPIKTLNFIGAGNTFLVNGTTVDISIQGGGGGAEIGVQANDSVIGYAQTTLNFAGTGVTGVSIGTTTTITIEPGLVGAAKSVTSFTATAGQTTFNVNYSAGQENVFLNGVRLSESQYTATNGSTVVLNDAASDGDSVDIVVYLRGSDPNRNVEVTILPPFNGITTAFTMYKGTTSYLFDPIDERQIVVSLGGVIQQPGVAYTVGTGSSIFFSAAPGAGVTCFITALYSNTVGVPTDAVKLNKQTYTPSGIQTTFTVTEGYSSGYLDVYRNGIRLVDGSDFTASNGTTFDLVTPATGGDVVDIIAYKTLNIQYAEFAGLSTNVDGGYGSLTNLQVSGISTLGNVKIGVGGTDLLVEGNARVTGILTVGPGSITLDGNDDSISVGTNGTVLSLSSAGNLGIGTSNPSGRVQIFDSPETGTLRIGGGNGAGNHRLFIQADPILSYIDSYGNDNYQALRLNASPLIFNSDTGGYVGIGTTNPSNRLTVRDDDLPTVARFRSANGSSYVDLQFENTTSNLGFMGYYKNHLSFFAGSSSNPTVHITSGGPSAAGRLLVGVATANENSNGGVLQLSGGITFPATQVTATDANTLDDYEEGSWSPVIRGSGTAGTYELSFQYGKYVKIGREVTVYANLSLSGSITGGGTGYTQITGFPFTKASGEYTVGFCQTRGIDFDAGHTYISIAPITGGSTTTFYLAELGDNITGTDLPIANLAATDNIVFTVSYLT